MLIYSLCQLAILFIMHPNLLSNKSYCRNCSCFDVQIFDNRTQGLARPINCHYNPSGRYMCAKYSYESFGGRYCAWFIKIQISITLYWELFPQILTLSLSQVLYEIFLLPSFTWVWQSWVAEPLSLWGHFALSWFSHKWKARDAE